MLKKIREWWDASILPGLGQPTGWLLPLIGVLLILGAFIFLFKG